MEITFYNNLEMFFLLFYQDQNQFKYFDKFFDKSKLFYKQHIRCFVETD